MRRLAPALIAALVGTATFTAAAAQERLDGYFIAFAECPAFQSKNSQSNPGDVMTEAMRAYEMIGINKAGGRFYQVKVPGAPGSIARWVSISCGLHVVAAGSVVPSGPSPSPLPDQAPQVINGRAGPESTDNLLTLSWQPAFCETGAGLRKQECKTLNAGGMEAAATRLSIHGLWPQPNGTFYCADAAPWKDLDAKDDEEVWEYPPTVEMTDATRAALAELMPGAISRLDRHEWVKHGSCYGAAGGSEEYFADTLLLARAINRSGLGDFLMQHVGQTVTLDAVHDIIDAQFGAGAAEAVEIRCFEDRDSGRMLLGEIWVSLEGEISAAADLGELMRASAGRTSDADCGIVTVDPTGEQG